MNVRLENLRAELLEKKETLQPLICVVGSLENPEKCLVVVDHIQYEVFSVFEALRLNFKIFWALNCTYSKKAEKFWSFLEVAGFEFQNTATKGGSTKSQALLQEFYEKKEMRTEHKHEQFIIS